MSEPLWRFERDMRRFNDPSWTVARAIIEADSLLKLDANSEASCQAILDVAQFLEDQPEPVWQFILRWGVHPDEDLRSYIACALLEHLLEHHFDAYFPQVEAFALKNSQFGHVFCMCWSFGQSEEPANVRRFNALKKRLGWGTYSDPR